MRLVGTLLRLHNNNSVQIQQNDQNTLAATSSFLQGCDNSHDMEHIWITRNAWIFNGTDPMLDNCKENFKEFALVIHRVKESSKNENGYKGCNSFLVYFLFTLFLFINNLFVLSYFEVLNI